MASNGKGLRYFGAAISAVAIVGWTHGFGVGVLVGVGIATLLLLSGKAAGSARLPVRAGAVRVARWPTLLALPVVAAIGALTVRPAHPYQTARPPPRAPSGAAHLIAAEANSVPAQRRSPREPSFARSRPVALVDVAPTGSQPPLEWQVEHAGVRRDRAFRLWPGSPGTTRPTATHMRVVLVFSPPAVDTGVEEADAVDLRYAVEDAVRARSFQIVNPDSPHDVVLEFAPVSVRTTQSPGGLNVRASVSAAIWNAQEEQQLGVVEGAARAHAEFDSGRADRRYLATSAIEGAARSAINTFADDITDRR